jgi:ribosomal protein S18 acetylase RimI-like enzyme
MLIRPAKPDDLQAVSKVCVESWRATYEGLAPEVFVRGITVESAADIFGRSLNNKEYLYFLHVAETPEAKIIGFADGGRERSRPEKGIGELYGLYLLKEFQGRGIGRALFQAAVKSLAQSGMDSMVAWILENSPHQVFYKKVGGVLEKGVKKLEWKDQSVSLVCYRWSDLKKTAF